MQIPLLDLSAQLAPLREEIHAAVLRVVDSTTYIQGPEVVALENEVARYCGAEFGVGVSSGTDALLISLMTLGIGSGDKVLTTPYSFFATMGVILRIGAVPVFVDIDPVTYNINPELAAEALKQDTEHRIKAILPVHLYGQCADMSPLLKLASEYDLPVIEDAAQAIGAEYPMDSAGVKKWKRAGSMSQAGCFSFFPSKNLGGIGDGGMVVTQDEKFADELRIMRNHGASPKYYHSRVGGNFRLDPVQAAVLRVKLPYLEQWHAARRRNAAQYNELFKYAGLCDEDMITLPQAVYAVDGSGKEINNHIYNQFILRVNQRDALRTWLLKNKIGCEVYYPLALHQQQCMDADINAGLHYPEAEAAAASSLALPVYPELTVSMQEHVVEVIADFYKQ